MMLDLHPKSITIKQSLRWTLDGDVWRCGPVEIVRTHQPNERTKYVTMLHGKVICREYGYSSYRDAMFAASHLGPIVQMRKEQDHVETKNAGAEQERLIDDSEQA